MKKFIKISGVIFCLLFFLSGCGKEKEEEHPSGISDVFYNTDRVVSNEYSVREIDINDLGISELSGIELDKENNLIYLSDKDNGVINVYNSNFEKIESISNEKLQFPSLLFHKNDGLLVICDGTDRLFQLDDQNEIINIFSLPTKDEGDYYIGLQAIGDLVYITYNAIEHEDARIIELDLNSGDYKVIKDNFVGFTHVDNNDVYFVNNFVPYRKKDAEGFHAGKNSLYKLQDGKVEIVGDFIETSSPCDFFFTDEYIYVYTAGWSSVDRYNKSFEYVDSIAVFKEREDESILKGDEKKMYFVKLLQQKLYEIESK